MSYALLNDDCRNMKAAGFYNLSYFCCTEFGSGIAGPQAIKPGSAGKRLVARCEHATVSPYARCGVRPANDPLVERQGRAMDPGNAAFQEYLLEQARRHVRNCPTPPASASTAWTGCAHVNFAPGADDHVGWYGSGRPAGILGQSWNALLPKIGQIMHGAGKVIFVNCCMYGHRLDYVRDVDGFYDE